ncbi:MAG: hypothetical protein ACI4JS_10920 [Oscillospiraceae bacterium]
MAIDPKLLMTIVEAARSEKIRNMVLYIVLFALGFVMLIFTAYGGMLSGLFCIVQNATLKADWSHYSKSISGVFDDLRSELSDELKKEVYDFMPDFSTNLSKAMISQSIEEDEVVAFDENDIVVPNAKYIYTVDTVVLGGSEAKRQTLSVEDGKESQTVEYICIGGEIYLPEFLAMFNVRQTQSYLIGIAESDTKEVDEKIEEIVGSVPETEEDFTKYMKEVWKSTIEGTGSANVGIFKTAALKSIIKNANLHGTATVDIEKSDNKLSIILETVDSDTWKKVFEIDETLWDYVEQEKMTIEMALNAAQIPEEERTISLDGVVQASLFEYFDGLFELPVSNSRFERILSEFGNTSALHTQNGSSVVNEGIILQLNKKAAIDHALQNNCDSFVEDVFIYDVWNMDDMGVEDKSKVYNRGAITIAYIIDVKKFRKAYGFPFPDIDGVVTDSGYVTLCLEYSCLNSLNYNKSNVGGSVPYTTYIGSTHDGAYDSRYDIGEWQHSSDSCLPHVGIKVQICSGKLSKPKDNDGTYNGLSRKDIGVAVNPRLWFKGLVISSNNTPDGVSPAQPK